MTNEEIRNRLFELKDDAYADFTGKLMPTVPREKVIGVRTPLLRSFAKEIVKEGEYGKFLSALPHKYYEEDNLHGFVIENIKDFDRCINELTLFLPHIDNWATCDCVRPKILKKEPEKTLNFALELLKSEETYTVRYGIGLLLSFYLDENFSAQQLEIVSGIKSEEYYINMMIAWYFATALAKQYDSAVVYLENRLLGEWVHNKTIQKAVESYRVPKERKEYLKAMRLR